jgi:peptide/nickel transport system permease protein
MALTRFLIRRILTGIVVLWVVATATFFLFFFRPVDIVARRVVSRAASPQVIEQVIRNSARPADPGQLLALPGQPVHGNLGYSYYNGASVKTIIAQDLPITASVVVGAMVLWLVVGLSVGVLSATRPRSTFDRASTVGVLAGLSMPTFVLGELLIIAVFVPLNQRGFSWIQTGYAPLSEGVIPWMGHMILPWITLAAVQAAVYTRLSRGSLIDTLGEDTSDRACQGAVRAPGGVPARAAWGPDPGRVPLGIDIGLLLGGVIVVEQMSSASAASADSVQAIGTGNLPLILGFVIVASLFVVVANIIVDVLYAVLDPRVRIS